MSGAPPSMPAPRTRRRLVVASALAASLLAGCPQEPAFEAPDAFRMRRDAAIDAPSIDAGRALCPPAPPYGTDVGEVLRNFVVYDCAGTPHRIHDLCETDVVWIWELAEWCSPCRRFADGRYDEIQARYEARYGERFEAFAVITADEELVLPNEAICAELRDKYGIEGPLYFDPTGNFRDVVGGLANDVHVIATRGLRVAWNLQFGGDFVDQRLQDTFDALDTGADVPDADISFDAGPLDDVLLRDDAAASDDAATVDATSDDAGP
jgi:thiol-disulfide isomerase/thioredoxin